MLINNLTFLLLLGSALPALANVTLPALITDNMVLQQKSDVALWGRADPGEAVTVTTSWAKAPRRAVADAQGNWLVRVPTAKAGGPYTLTIKGNNILIINNVMLGEVWLCSGQSNMNFPVAKRANSGWATGLVNAPEVMAQANYPNIRLFTVPQKVADAPLRDTQGRWSECSPETIGDFSAVAYFFGKEVQAKTGYPIGLINSSWGGTPAESWTRKDVLERDPELQPILARYEQGLATYAQDRENYQAQLIEYQKERAENRATTRVAPREPVGATSNKSPYKLYNGMIHPLVPYTLKGVLWYQGESNVEHAFQYRKLFSALISSWRAEWKQPDLPFYFVQIAPHRTGNPELRESQLVTMQALPHTGMAVITDWGDSLDIHPRNKEVVGHRLALWALAHEYGQKNLACSGPIYRDMQVESGKVRLNFAYAAGGLVAQTSPLKQFTVAGPDSVFLPAQAKIEGKSVVVWSDQVKQPVAVRFAWREVPKPDLFNTAGLPATPFRTDRWHTPTQGKQ
jgi:sialate O-acetylesterase